MFTKYSPTITAPGKVNVKGNNTGSFLPELKPIAVKAWLQGLSLNHNESINSLGSIISLLHLINGSQVNAVAEHLEILEPLRAKARVLLEKIRPHYIDSGLPYNSSAEMTIKASQEVNQLLAMAYARPCLETKSPTSDDKNAQLLALSLYRAMQHHGLYLLHLCQHYKRPDEAYWTRLYQMYQWAEDRQLGSISLQDADEPQDCRTISGQFRRIVAFYLANIYRLRQLHMVKLYSLLGQFVSMVEISTTDSPLRQPAEFEVYLDTPEPPRRRTRLSMAQPESDRVRLITTGELARNLKRSASTRNPLDMAYELDQITLNRIAATFEAKVGRNSTRHKENLECHYLLGLQSLIDHKVPTGAVSQNLRGKPRHALLQKQLEIVPLEGEINKVSRFDTRGERSEIALKRDVKSRPREGLHADRGQSQDFMTGMIWVSENDREKSREVFKAVIHDSSAGGYQISPVGKVSPRLKVGELIGIWVDDPVFIGTIRWLDIHEGEMRLGIELLAPEAKVARLITMDGKEWGLGLLLPAIPAIRDQPELLAPLSIVRTGSAFSILAKVPGINYEVNEIVEVTGSYVRLGLNPR